MSDLSLFNHTYIVADDGKASSEAEEVPEEIITSAMDDSESKILQDDRQSS